MAQTEHETRATNDAYTGMLAISLLALIGGCVLLYLDFSQYPERNPPKVSAPPMPLVQPDKGGAPNQPPPAPIPGPQGAAKGNPMPPMVNPMP